MSEVKRTDAIAGEIVHVYDGIEEADNALPAWWVAVFIISMVFAAGYWFSFQSFHLEPSPAEAFALAQAERATQTGVVSDDDVRAASQTASVVAAGQQAFATTCVVCHGTKAEGNIGPNLTDAQWLHGGAPAQIFSTIRDGVPSKGMPTWGPVLGNQVTLSLAAYVVSLRNKNVPGKAAQGDTYAEQ